MATVDTAVSKTVGNYVFNTDASLDQSSYGCALAVHGLLIEAPNGRSWWSWLNPLHYVWAKSA
jgi:hypothetical protein